jgi:hypothetical protein
MPSIVDAVSSFTRRGSTASGIAGSLGFSILFTHISESSLLSETDFPSRVGGR